MPKVSEEYITKKKKGIVDAAYRLCLRKTVSTVTMQDIIDELGFSQGAIYRFYKDIDDIFSDMILKLRNQYNMKGTIDEILDNKDLDPYEVTHQIFHVLGEFMEKELMEIEKIDFEINILAMNAPERTKKIMEKISGIGNMEYLANRTLEYFREQRENGRIKPRIKIEEILSYIESAYSGIQMTCIVNHCYQHNGNPLSYLQKPVMQLDILARTVNYLLGKEE